MTFQAKTSTQTFLPGKSAGLPRFNGKFPGNILVSLLRIHREIPASAGVLIPGKLEIYRDIAPRYFTDELPVNFQFPGKSLYLFSLGTSQLSIKKIHSCKLEIDTTMQYLFIGIILQKMTDLY